MRKDSVIFLRKLLEYRQEVKEDNFLINYQHFKDIPSIENAVFDILEDLINNNCLTSNSRVTDLEGNININLTLDGITYFEDSENKGRDESIIFNVSGGQVNIANDNGKIEAVQNTHFENGLEEVQNEVWMEIIGRWGRYIDIDNWEAWTSYLLGSGQPRLFIDNNEKLNDLLQWMLKKIWPEEVEELKEVLLNFYSVLNDFLTLFHEHSEQKDYMFYTEKFYRKDRRDDDLCYILLDRYNNHVNLVQDFVLELTRAANYVCDIVRKHINSNYRMEEGKLVVVTGPNKDLGYDTLLPEYKGNERKTFRPYQGLEQFKKDRYNRDFHFGDHKGEFPT